MLTRGQRGVYLSDLVFIDEGNLDEIDGKINFEKRQLVYTTVQALQLFQTSRYREIPLIQPLNQFLKWVPVLTDDQLYHVSLLREPRGATRETIK